MADHIVPAGKANRGKSSHPTQGGGQGQEYVFSYGTTRVRVIVPAGVPVRPIAKTWHPHFDTPAAGSAPRRKCMNLAFVEENDPTDTKFVTTFSSPVDVWVLITPDDTSQGKDKSKLELHYCEQGRQWQSLPGVTLSPAGDELGVSRSNWGADPGIGVH